MPYIFDNLKIFYINLSHRTDRNEFMIEQLKKYNLYDHAERIEAIKNDFGAVGCCMSHICALKKGFESNFEYVMILEDDFKFNISPEEFMDLLNEIQGVNFDVFMIGYNIKHPKYAKSYNKNIFKITKAQTASAYIINKKYINILIKHNEENLQKLIKTRRKNKYAIDKSWSILQSKNNWFCMKKRTGQQIESYSDIENRIVNYGV